MRQNPDWNSYRLRLLRIISSRCWLQRLLLLFNGGYMDSVTANPIETFASEISLRILWRAVITHTRKGEQYRKLKGFLNGLRQYLQVASTQVKVYQSLLKMFGYEAHLAWVQFTFQCLSCLPFVLRSPSKIYQNHCTRIIKHSLRTWIQSTHPKYLAQFHQYSSLSTIYFLNSQVFISC